MNESAVGTMMVYCCGGTGINIGKYFTTLRNKKERDGFANIKIAFIDTSLSNISSEIEKDEIYLVEGLDGSGKIRSENHKEIGESIHDVLLRYPPQDINIVLSSTSGGSGSVVAPLIVGELLKREKNVIVSAVASLDSRIEVENSVKTLKSYEAIAQMRNTPVAMLAYENSAEKSRNEVNDDARQDIIKIAALFSKQNKELDSADLRNWLNYPRVTKLEPKVVKVDFHNGPLQTHRVHIVTCATLAYENMNTNLGSTVDYQCVGYIPSDNQESVALADAMHYLIVDGLIGDIYTRLSEALAKIDEQNMAKKRSTVSLVDASDRVGGDGLVF